eukprot:TRINITY_DN8101_c0_g1_i1.p1 TRINITY_DN8101_c0_g1~~TRINITY_DN8101_c0_g1_i1.p1  ORF type:complete len:734 (+),score=202.30 TRINITY_DN8101_c0_g1_i1:118-2319(+)
MPKRKANDVQSRSPAEFFAENKSIAGFDNPGKSLYTTIREFVENGLDAAEEIDVLPSIAVEVTRVPNHAISDLYGLKKKQAKAASEDDRAAPEVDAKKAKGKTKAEDNAYYQVVVKDNGMGMPHAQIPNMLAKVLSGTKYTLKQARGRFGLGAKMALIWAKMTSGIALEVYTARPGSKHISHCVLDIDLHLNEPKVHVYERLPNDGSVAPLESDINVRLFGEARETDTGFLPAEWHGTQIAVVIQGNWSDGHGAYRWNIIKYMRRLAVITPYAEFLLQYRDTDQQRAKSLNMKILYPRRSQVSPPLPKEVNPHPSSVDLVGVEDLISRSQSLKLVKFLQNRFSCITSKEAKATVQALGHKFDGDELVSELSKQQIQHLVGYLTAPARNWRAPPKDSLSPAGTYNMYLGIMKELKPDMIATYNEPASVYQGHPFIVEAAVSLGGKTVPQGINIYRFANRIPLIFEEKSDVISKTAAALKWGNYKINKNTDKIGVFVSIVSTKVPFKGTGKEFISDDIPPIKKAVKAALQHCCTQLKSKIARTKADQANKDRKASLLKYAPNVCKSIFGILQAAAERGEEFLQARQGFQADRGVELPASTSVSRLLAPSDVLTAVTDESLTARTLHDRLKTHIEQHDADAALAYVTQTGRVDVDAKDNDLAILPLDKGASFLKVDHPLGGLFLLAECFDETEQDFSDDDVETVASAADDDDDDKAVVDADEDDVDNAQDDADFEI